MTEAVRIIEGATMTEERLSRYEGEELNRALVELDAAETEIERLHAEVRRLRAANARLVSACKSAAEFYDLLAVGTSPLGWAAKHGPDDEPPTPEEWDRLCLEMREELDAALAHTEDKTGA